MDVLDFVAQAPQPSHVGANTHRSQGVRQPWYGLRGARGNCHVALKDSRRHRGHTLYSLCLQWGGRCACIGLDALGAGLLEIDWKAFEVVYAYDIDASLAAALVRMHGERAASFHIGNCGDLLACNVQEWDRVDWVIAGPPCPPYSAIRNRGVAPQNDPRERLFLKVTEIISHQAKLRCFGFICEMVEGIAHRSREQNYYSDWLQTLAEQAPMFRIHGWTLNSARYLPQNQPQIYTVGVLRELVGDVGMRGFALRVCCRAP